MRKPQSRSERVPLGSRQPKLGAPERKGYVRRFVNDVGGRLQDAKAGGYQFVEDETTVEGAESDGLGNRVTRVVGTKESGAPLNAYLMEIKEDWYKEDQAVKQAEIDETEESLRRGTDEHGVPGKDGRYVPKQGIKIGRR